MQWKCDRCFLFQKLCRLIMVDYFGICEVVWKMSGTSKHMAVFSQRMGLRGLEGVRQKQTNAMRLAFHLFGCLTSVYEYLIYMSSIGHSHVILTPYV